MELKKMLFVCMLVCMTMAPVGAVDLTVDFDGGDCSREFTVSQYDVYYLKADPNPLTSGGAASCTVRFRTSSAFNIYVQSVHVQDCTAKLFFYDNDNTQKYPSQTLSCIPTVDSGGTFKTRTGNLIVRLEKGSGSTKAYSFTVVLTTIEGQSVSDQVTDTAGGGVGTGAIIGIAVGVVAFLIIIIAVVCFFVCRQMAQQKEEKMRQQPSIFATAASDPTVVIEREGDRQRNREPIPNLNGSYSRRHRPYDPPEENYQQLKLPEPKPNGILKGSQRRSRRRTQGEDSGHDNPGYSASVSSTDDSCDFDFQSYQNSKISGLPQKVKNFSMDPDPSRARRERSERGRRERPSSQTSDSSLEDGAGFTNKAFTDESGRSQSLGRAAGRRRYLDDDETATNYTRSTRSDRSLSPSRTENSSDTGVTTGTTGSRFERNPNAASIRRSRSRSHSTNRKPRHHHHHHHDHSDQSSQGSHGSHNHHGHHGHRGHHGSHRSRSREKKKSPNLPIFDEVKKMQKAKK